MLLRAIFGGDCPVSLVYRNGVIIWRGVYFKQLTGASIGLMDSDAALTQAEAEILRAASQAKVTGEGSLSTAGSAAGAAEKPLEVIPAAGLYARQVSHCRAEEALALEPEAQANAPLASPCAAAGKGAVLSLAAAHAPAAAPGGAETGLKSASCGEAAAVPARPLTGAWAWDYTLEAQAALTAAPAAALAAREAVGVDAEAAADREITKYYTVRFLDGDTVLDTQQVGHGEKAVPPDTTKDGYNFMGWTPSDLTITADTDFVGTWDVQPPEDLIPEQTVTCTSYILFGPYSAALSSTYEPSDYVTCIVVFDGVEYICPMKSANYANAKVLYLFGNPNAMTMVGTSTSSPDSGEPFAILWSGGWRLSMRDPGTHTVRVYQI